MRYMGGKFRQSTAITKELVRMQELRNELAHQNTTYLEPFCGALGAARKAIPALANLGITRFVMSDGSEALITMWQAFVDGWDPPDWVTPEEYLVLKNTQDPQDPMTAHVGFGASFGASFFSAYAFRHDLDRAKHIQVTAKNTSKEKAALLRKYKVELHNTDYQNWGDERGAVFYLDPPYHGRTKAHDFDTFDNDAYWEWAKELSMQNDVIVTGFEAPDDWTTLYSWGDTVAWRGGGPTQSSLDKAESPKRIDERIFRYVNSQQLQLPMGEAS